MYIRLSWFAHSIWMDDVSTRRTRAHSIEKCGGDSNVNGHTSINFHSTFFLFFRIGGLPINAFASIAQILFLLFSLWPVPSLCLSISLLFIWPMFLLTRSLFIAFRSVIYWPNFMFVTSMRTDKFHRKYVSEPSFFFFFSMLPSFCMAHICFVALRMLAQFCGFHNKSTNKPRCHWIYYCCTVQSPHTVVSIPRKRSLLLIFPLVRSMKRKKKLCCRRSFCLSTKISFNIICVVSNLFSHRTHTNHICIWFHFTNDWKK